VCGDSHTNSDALSKHLECSSVSDECRSRAERVFHEVEPDEQNAWVPMEAMSDLGTKSLLSSEERRCGRPDKVDKRTHALVRYSAGARSCKHVMCRAASVVNQNIFSVISLRDDQTALVWLSASKQIRLPEPLRQSSYRCTLCCTVSLNHSVLWAYQHVHLGVMYPLYVV